MGQPGPCYFAIQKAARNVFETNYNTESLGPPSIPELSAQLHQHSEFWREHL